MNGGQGCDKHGQAIDLLMDYKGMMFNQSMAALPDDIDDLLRRVEDMQGQGDVYNW